MMTYWKYTYGRSGHAGKTMTRTSTTLYRLVSNLGEN